MLKQSLFFFICALCLLTCEDEIVEPNNPNPNPSLNKIMPLGASRVEGARPVFESYRYELWKRLVEGGWEFDYIGTMEDEASYPSFQGSNFDDDHEGRGGWTSGEILDGLSDWLNQTGAPDIVLFSSPGGNDALQALPYDEALNNINQIIDILQAANPNITIIIEQMAPARSDEMTPALTAFFEQSQQDIPVLAQAQTTTTSMVIPVNMYTGFNDSLLADPVHYNEAGAGFIAERYYEQLVQVLR